MQCRVAPLTQGSAGPRCEAPVIEIHSTKSRCEEPGIEVHSTKSKHKAPGLKVHSVKLFSLNWQVLVPDLGTRQLVTIYDCGFEPNRGQCRARE